MVLRMALVLACVLGGCVESRSVICGPLVCSEASVCAPSGDRCVQSQQLDVCTGQADGAGCSFPGVSAGSCSKGICEPVGCGNGVVEADLAEVCDDGNRLSGDGCNGLCTSRELCGDGVAEASQGEQCDCGDGTMTVVGCTGPNSNDPGATCRPDTCQLARCGDGIIDPFEACDDGNTTPGDGCRADCQGRWTVMASATFATLEAIWGSGPDDIYAVGGGGVIVHYDGTSWSRMATPTPAADYRDVWGAGGEVFAVGNASNAGRVDRFDGTSWATVRQFPSQTFVFAIHGRAANDFWIAGVASGASTALLLQHYTGTWPSVSSTCTGVLALSSLWADPATQQVWAANDNGEVCRFNSASWSVVTGAEARRVWGSSGSDLYGVAAGSSTLVAQRSVDGTTWTDIPETAPMQSADGVGGAANDVLIVGQDGRAMQFDGTTWSIVASPVPFDLYDVWGYAENRAFVVGQNGTILF